MENVKVWLHVTVLVINSEEVLEYYIVVQTTDGSARLLKFRILLSFLHVQADYLKRNNPNNFYQHPTFVVDFFAQRSAVVINLY